MCMSGCKCQNHSVETYILDAAFIAIIATMNAAIASLSALTAFE